MKNKDIVTDIGIGVYLKEDYPKILAMSVDSDKMEPTWERWKAQKDLLKLKLLSQGILTMDILVKPDALSKYCKQNHLPIEGASRAQYVQHLVSNL
jgi:hypothetical protein